MADLPSRTSVTGIDGTALLYVVKDPAGVPSDGKITITQVLGDIGITTKVGTPVDDQIGVWTGDGTIEGAATLTRDANALKTTLDIELTEKADHSSTPAAGKGYLWVKNDTPSKLIFTDDTGADTELSFGSIAFATSRIIGSDADDTAYRAMTPADARTVMQLVGKTMIPILAQSLTPNTTNGAASGATETTTNDVMLATLDFDQTTDESAQITLPMPKSWNEGTFTARFRWTAGATGDVVWGIQAVALSDDDPVDAAFGTAQSVTDSVTLADDLMISAETSAVTIAGTPAEGDLVVFKVFRDADNVADTLAADAKLIAVDLFITTDASIDA